MKLLFDENLSPRLPRLLAARFPDSVHVRDCGLRGRPDDEVWEFARARGFTVISKDSDFYERGLLHGQPPKFVWLRVGNCTRDELVTLILRHEQQIHALAADPFGSVLALS